MTPRKREKAWSDFAAWCRHRGLRALPAHPWTVAAYARWCEARHRYPVILERIKAIARVHLLACVTAPDRHPTVTCTLRTLEMRSRTRSGRAALFPVDDIAEGADRVPAEPVRRRRPRVLRLTPRLVSRPPRRS
ncbi:MAG: hypothetical protein U1E33_04985 [Rhodospirillales bacterium]